MEDKNSAVCCSNDYTFPSMPQNAYLENLQDGKKDTDRERYLNHVSHLAGNNETKQKKTIQA